MNKVIVLIKLLCIAAFAQQKGTFTDVRDSNEYKIVKIGEQIWMAENLNLNVNSSKCYENNSENCNKYGRLYNWYIAMVVCPYGWHLPRYEEWYKLIKTIGDYEMVGKRLKAESHWSNNDNSEDIYGFMALPGGFGTSNGYFLNASNHGSWWSAFEYNGSEYAVSLRMSYNYEGIHNDFSGKNYLRSVRCVKD